MTQTSTQAGFRLDHIVIAVADLDSAIADYRKLGFTVFPGGTHHGGASQNALVVFADGSYFELIAYLKPSPDVRWFPVGDLPTNMLDRARVALRNYADGMRFSTYPAFVLAGTGGADGVHAVNGFVRSDEPSEADESNTVNGLFGSGESYGANEVSQAKERSSRSRSPARRKEASGRRLLG